MMIGGTYPVNLIQVVRLQDDGADDTGTRSSLHLDLIVAEEGVELGVHGGSIGILVDGELGTIITIANDGVVGAHPAGIVTSGEVT